MRSYRNFKIIFISLIAVLLFACSGEEIEKPPFEPDYLHEATLVKTISKNQIIASLAAAGMNTPGLSLYIRFDVEAVRIVYHTTGTGGEPVLASGVLFRPATDLSFPLLSFQHGAIEDPQEAPSLLQSIYSDLGAMFAATGFVVSMPDYLGYGASAAMEHTFIHRNDLATATRDMIRASTEYFLQQDITGPSGKLFISGYSQGGYATLATLKLLEEEHSEEFNVTAATAGAGPYNVTASVKQLLASDDNYEDINTFIRMLDALNKAYPELRRPYTFFYNEPWATVISSEGVFAQVEKNPHLLFTEDFIAGIVNNTDTEFLDILADNDIFSWKPNTPLQLYHGDADERVPFMNAETAFQAMNDLHAARVELVTIVNGNHLSAFPDYMIGTFVFFFPFLTAN